MIVIRHLKKYFPLSKTEVLKAVDDVSLDIKKEKYYRWLENLEVVKRLLVEQLQDYITKHMVMCI